jgi:hypothetical protein
MTQSLGEQRMKRKPVIPDFSKKKKGVQQHGVPDEANKGQHQHLPNPQVRPKPTSTSIKSGRRGS